MQNQYTISSECIAAIIYRISLCLGDFEGLLYGSKQKITTSKLRDDGSYESIIVTMINNVFIFNSQKIISGSAQIQENIKEIPKEMKVVGWIAGRREVPPLPSVGDRSTYTYLSGLTEKFPNFFVPDLIFGLFISKNVHFESAAEIEIGRQTIVSPFEYKFFNPKENFVSIKVIIENLKDTQSKYNDLCLTYSLSSTQENFDMKIK